MLLTLYSFQSSSILKLQMNQFLIIFKLHVAGHVIPAEHLLSVALDRGPSGQELDFTYQSRESTELVPLNSSALSSCYNSSVAFHT